MSVRGAVRGAASTVVLGLVHSTLWVAIGAGSLAVTTMVLADLPLDPLPVALVVAATVLVYGLDRVRDVAVDERNVPDRARFVRQYGRWVVLAAAILYIAFVAVAAFRGVPGWWLLWAPPVAALAYSRRAIRRHVLVKNLLVGMGWATIPLGVGIYHGTPRATVVLATGAVALVALTVAAMVFDLKDVHGDRLTGTRTVATEYGPRVVVGASVVTMGLLGAAVLAGVSWNRLPSAVVVLVGYPVYVGAYSLLATTDRSTFYYGFVVDGEHLAVALLALLLA